MNPAPPVTRQRTCSPSHYHRRIREGRDVASLPRRGHGREQAPRLRGDRRDEGRQHHAVPLARRAPRRADARRQGAAVLLRRARLAPRTRVVRRAVRRHPGRAPHGRGLRRVRRPAHRRRGGPAAARHPARRGPGLLRRDPATRLRSHFRHEVLRGRETKPLSVAVAAPRNAYVARSSYGEVLRPWLAAAPDRLLVVVSEELFADETTWPVVLEHLGLPPAPKPIRAHNSTEGKAAFSPVMRRLWDIGLVEAVGRRVPRPPGRSAASRGRRCSATRPGSHPCSLRRTSPCRTPSPDGWRRRWPRPSGCSDGRCRTPWPRERTRDRHRLVPGRLGRPRPSRRGRARASGGHDPVRLRPRGPVAAARPPGGRRGAGRPGLGPRRRRSRRRRHRSGRARLALVEDALARGSPSRRWLPPRPRSALRPSWVRVSW